MWLCVHGCYVMWIIIKKNLGGGGGGVCAWILLYLGLCVQEYIYLCVCVQHKHECVHRYAWVCVSPTAMSVHITVKLAQDRWEETLTAHNSNFALLLVTRENSMEKAKMKRMLRLKQRIRFKSVLANITTTMLTKVIEKMIDWSSCFVLFSVVRCCRKTGKLGAKKEEGLFVQRQTGKKECTCFKPKLVHFNTLLLALQDISARTDGWKHRQLTSFICTLCVKFKTFVIILFILLIFIKYFVIEKNISIHSHNYIIYFNDKTENYKRLTVVEEIIWRRERGREGERERVVCTHTHTHTHKHTSTHTHTLTHWIGKGGEDARVS